jgi:pSer/pThr/pTyr-binding forkhead associated (FHA) protein
MAKITVLFGNDPQSERTLDKPELRIGRAMDCDIVVDNLGVSRHHCSIVQDGEGWALHDKGSNNGTFINGQKVDRHPFKHLDRVVLGKHSLVFDAYGYAAEKTDDKKAGNAMGGEMTMFVDQAQLAKMANKGEGAGKRMALALMQGGREVVLPLNKDETTVGTSADVPAKGFLVKAVQAKLVKSPTGHRLIAGGGLRSVKVNGSKVKDAELKAGDVITIAGQTMTYKSAS